MAPAINLKGSEMFLITEWVFGDGDYGQNDLERRSPSLTHTPTRSPQKHSFSPLPACYRCSPILPQTVTLKLQPLTSRSGCAVCAASAGCGDWLRKVNTTEDQIFKLRCLAFMKLSAEMSDVIKLLFKIPVKTWLTFQTSGTFKDLLCKVPNT